MPLPSRSRHPNRRLLEGAPPETTGIPTSLTLGWALFLLSFCLPALVLPHQNGSHQTVFGFMAALGSVAEILTLFGEASESWMAIYTLCNVLTLITPLCFQTLYRDHELARKWALVMLGATSLAASFPFVAAFQGFKVSLHIGFFVWLFSMGAVTAGMFARAGEMKEVTE